jgi:hypothetical protein
MLVFGDDMGSRPHRRCRKKVDRFSDANFLSFQHTRFPFISTAVTLTLYHYGVAKHSGDGLVRVLDVLAAQTMLSLRLQKHFSLLLPIVSGKTASLARAEATFLQENDVVWRALDDFVYKIAVTMPFGPAGRLPVAPEARPAVATGHMYAANGIFCSVCKNGIYTH